MSSVCQSENVTLWFAHKILINVSTERPEINWIIPGHSTIVRSTTFQTSTLQFFFWKWTDK